MSSTDPVPGLVLRRAVEDDEDQVASVYLAARRAAPMPPPVGTDEAVRYWVSAKLEGDDETWVADVDGSVVGYARLAGGWLDDLYVAPPYAGQGVGGALLDLVKSLRPDGFSLWVFAGNLPARRFYRRRGLVQLEHTDGHDNAEQAPDIRLAWCGRDPLTFLRSLIDEVDDELGALLARRAALTAAVQEVKPVAGHAGRDRERERQIVERLARHAPSLGPERLGRIVRVLVAESLDAAAEGPGGPVGGPP